MGREGIVAIDAHVHLSDEAAQRARGARTAQMARYFGHERKVVSVDEMADQYRARQMMAVLMNGTDVATTGIEPVPNAHIADAMKRHPDVFLGFGAVEPALGSAAIEEVKRIADLGLPGVGELNPGRQQFFPNDPRFYPLWEECAKQRLVVLFHTGMMGAGAGTPGGMGFKLKYTQPIFVDEVAADFPELSIIAAHPSWPWTAESLAMARHKANVYLDLSGWAPRYFPQELVQHVGTILQDKALFGSDWPAIPVERWLEEFEALPLKPEVKRKILLENARKLFAIA